MQNLPGADFATAFAVCVAYVTFVVVGTVRSWSAIDQIKMSLV